MTGTEFEKEFCKILSNKGFWATRLAKKADGSQPFDVIAAKNSKVQAYECKVIQNYRFDLSRVEDNQMRSHKKWLLMGNYNCFNVAFYVKHTKEVYIMPMMRIIEAVRSDVPSILVYDKGERWK